MAKNNEITAISKADLDYIRQELSEMHAAPELSDLAMKLAFKKNASQLSQSVKTYDPNRGYDIGDLICKAYDEPLMVSSKGVEHFSGSVVLTVINKIPYPDFNCAMLEVDYTGGGVFRRHIDYMKKTKTQVLLPSALSNGAPEAEMMDKDSDPRLNELPMTEKDLRTLGKNLRASMSKSDTFFHWNDRWQLTERQVSVPDKTVAALSKHLRKAGHSLPTTKIVTDFLKTPEDHEDFPIHCLSLNHILDKNHKKTFLFACPADWGQWALKETLLGLLKASPLASPTLPLPESVTERKPVSTVPAAFPLRVYLSWREILSGGIQIPSGLTRELSRCREYIFDSTESKESFPVFYYPTRGIILGLAEFYKKHQVTQGASLTLDKVDTGKIQFTLKTSKKKIAVPQVGYDAKKKRFASDGEVQTFCLPNKILYLRSETLEKLFSLHDEAGDLELRELLILIFKSFGLEGEALSLHFERAFHMADMLHHTTLEDVEKTLIGSPEFELSEKKAGLYLYYEKVKTEEEIIPDIVSDDSLESPAFSSEEASSGEDEDLPAIGTVGEIETPTVVLEESTVVETPPVEETPPVTEAEPEVEPEPADTETVPEPVPVSPEPTAPAVEPSPPAPEPVEETTPSPAPPPPAPAKAAAEASKKEKESKKKKRVKPETERMPRRGKGEKRIIEERIELEESEMEALFAVKTAGKVDEDIKVDKISGDDGEFIKPQDSAEAPLGGLFGEKLKSALSHKIEDKKTENKKPAKPSRAAKATKTVKAAGATKASKASKATKTAKKASEKKKA